MSANMLKDAEDDAEVVRRVMERDRKSLEHLKNKLRNAQISFEEATRQNNVNKQVERPD